MLKRKNAAAALIAFALVFGGLLVTATFFDLQISQLLTKNVLPAGQYYTEHFFGALFETIGTCPEYIVGAFCVQVLFIYLRRFKEKNSLHIILQILLALVSLGLYLTWYQNVLNYVLRHYGAEFPPFAWGVAAFLALLTSSFSFFAANTFSDKSIKKLVVFAFAAVAGILTALAIVELLKFPFGRMRYRAMNTVGDFSYYTRWYVLNGQPDKEWMRSMFGTSDACKSFPSGHTRSAAATFYIIPIMNAIGVTSKKKRAAGFAAAFCFTALVAISRIAVGAHFLSDVLVGGTTGFLCAMAVNDVVISRVSRCTADG